MVDRGSFRSVRVDSCGRIVVCEVFMKRMVWVVWVVWAVGCPSEGVEEAKGVEVSAAAAVTPWPPVLGERFPDLELRDVTGAVRRLSEHEGKVVLVEPIGMNCPGCLAFVGAHEQGDFRGWSPQAGLPSLERIVAEGYPGLDLGHPDLVRIQLLLYDESQRRAPTLEDAVAWAEHFELAEEPNVEVWVGDAGLVNPASYAMIPGFFLVRRDFTLAVDNAGHHPPHDMGRLLQELQAALAP